jgi:hypothetical protein
MLWVSVVRPRIRWVPQVRADPLYPVERRREANAGTRVAEHHAAAGLAYAQRIRWLQRLRATARHQHEDDD